jgi:hypothetical protein
MQGVALHRPVGYAQGLIGGFLLDAGPATVPPRDLGFKKAAPDIVIFFSEVLVL